MNQLALIPHLKAYLRWRGNKDKVAGRIVSLLPTCNRFYEPFAGSAVISLNMRATGAAKSLCLADTDSRIVALHTAVRDDLPRFRACLQSMITPAVPNRIAFERIKVRYASAELQNRDASHCPTERAALFAALITGSLYCDAITFRDTGSFANKLRLCLDRATAAQPILAGAEIRQADFAEITPGAGDLVYCDPPYTGRDNRFYPRWSADDDARLVESAREWLRNGAAIAVSNMATWRFPLPHEAYPIAQKGMKAGSDTYTSDYRMEALFIAMPGYPAG